MWMIYNRIIRNNNNKLISTKYMFRKFGSCHASKNDNWLGTQVESAIIDDRHKYYNNLRMFIFF